MRKIFLIIILAVSSFSVFAQQKSGIKTKADALAFMRYFVSYTSKGLPLSLYGNVYGIKQHWNLQEEPIIIMLMAKK